MTKFAAMKEIDKILRKNFKYLYKRQDIPQQDTFHLTFQMDSKTHELQMALIFEDNWCDILCFISPTAIIPEGEIYWEVLQFVNCVNWSIKSFGRFYLDTNGDLAYSLRLDYTFLELMPHKFLKEVECAIDYYSDLFLPLLNVIQGKMSFKNIKRFIDDMWGGMQ